MVIQMRANQGFVVRYQKSRIGHAINHHKNRLARFKAAGDPDGIIREVQAVKFLKGMRRARMAEVARRA